MQSLVNTKQTGRWIIPATCSLFLLLHPASMANAEGSAKNEAEASGKNAAESSTKNEAEASRKNAAESSTKNGAEASSKNAAESSTKNGAEASGKNAAESSTKNSSAGITKDQSEIEQTIHQQKECWNKGNLDGFMSAYLNSKDICFTSAGVEVWGYDALRERYQKKYGSNKETMGKLDFRDLKITELSPKSALAIGHWHLDRKDASPMDGTFSLVLLKKNNAWKIIHDHTSLLSEKK